MAIYAIIEDGVVINTVVAENKLDESWVLCSGEAGIGWNYDGTNFTENVTNQTEEQIRMERDRLLEETDFYALPDVTMSAEMTTYRQALRDLPAQEGFPDTITWPNKPS